MAGNENFSPEETVNDLNIISDKLGRVVRYKKKEIEDIKGVQKNIDASILYWQSRPNPSSALANASILSGTQVIHDFRNYVDSLRPEQFTGPVLGSVMASGDSMGSIAMTLLHVAPPSEPVQKDLEIKFIEIKYAPERKVRREEVRTYLKKISSHLADAYEGAWENLETTFSDPSRGAALMMREVISQTIDLLAPDKLVKEQPGFVPDAGAKDGVTRRHKLEYIGNKLARDSAQQRLIEGSMKSFLDTYAALCEAHKRTPLDRAKTESFLLQADDLLILILRAIRLE